MIAFQNYSVGRYQKEVELILVLLLLLCKVEENDEEVHRKTPPTKSLDHVLLWFSELACITITTAWPSILYIHARQQSAWIVRYRVHRCGLKRGPAMLSFSSR